MGACGANGERFARALAGLEDDSGDAPPADSDDAEEEGQTGARAQRKAKKKGKKKSSKAAKAAAPAAAPGAPGAAATTTPADDDALFQEFASPAAAATPAQGTDDGAGSLSPEELAIKHLFRLDAKVRAASEAAHAVLTGGARTSTPRARSSAASAQTSCA